MSAPLRRLIALDIDGTIVRPDGTISPSVTHHIRRLDLEGHHVVLTTGRSWTTTLPVLEQLAVQPDSVVCSNGAVTLRRRPGAPGGYLRNRVKSFDPHATVSAIRRELPDAILAAEDRSGRHRFTAPFPAATTEPIAGQAIVAAAALVDRPVVRLAAIAPVTPLEAFLEAVERMRLRHVQYSLGWTAWLDIAAEGVTKADAVEDVRRRLGVPRDRVVAVGDGHNDLELLGWAAQQGRGVAMGHAPVEVIARAGEVTHSIHEDGLAAVLRQL